jgi:GDP-mannose 6-dehydrogenase
VMPQFGRGGTSVADFFSPPKTVIGSSDPRAAAAISCFTQLIDSNAIHTSIELAEMAKRADTLWHATRLAFDEDISRLCAALNIDGGEALDIFRRNARSAPAASQWAGPERRKSNIDGRDLAAVLKMGVKLRVSLPLFKSLMGRKAKA